MTLPSENSLKFEYTEPDFGAPYRYGKISFKDKNINIETPSFSLITKTGSPQCLTPDLLSKIDIQCIHLNLGDMFVVLFSLLFLILTI